MTLNIQSVKMQIIARLLAICQPLIAEQKFLKVERKQTLFLLESVKPALHLVIGDERVLYQDERGYNMQFPVLFKLLTESPDDGYNQADKAAAFVQEKIEADEQLNRLASKVTYDGEMPFTEEVLKPAGGTVITYLVEYRRMKAQPSVNY